MSPPKAGRRLRRTSVLGQRHKTLAQGEFTSPEHLKSRGPRGMEHPVGKCGITFEKFQDIKEGDIIEAFIREEIER